MLKNINKIFYRVVQVCQPGEYTAPVPLLRGELHRTFDAAEDEMISSGMSVHTTIIEAVKRTLPG